MEVYLTSQGCTATHSHLQAGQDSIHIPDASTDRHCVLEKQPREEDHWMVTCSECEI